MISVTSWFTACWLGNVDESAGLTPPRTLLISAWMLCSPVSAGAERRRVRVVSGSALADHDDLRGGRRARGHIGRRQHEVRARGEGDTIGRPTGAPGRHDHRQLRIDLLGDLDLTRMTDGDVGENLGAVDADVRGSRIGVVEREADVPAPRRAEVVRERRVGGWRPGASDGAGAADGGDRRPDLFKNPTGVPRTAFDTTALGGNRGFPRGRSPGNVTLGRVGAPARSSSSSPGIVHAAPGTRSSKPAGSVGSHGGHQRSPPKPRQVSGTSSLSPNSADTWGGFGGRDPAPPLEIRRGGIAVGPLTCRSPWRLTGRRQGESKGGGGGLLLRAQLLAAGPVRAGRAGRQPGRVPAAGRADRHRRDGGDRVLGQPAQPEVQPGGQPARAPRPGPDAPPVRGGPGG